MLYHRYRIDEAGTIRHAKIVPPTSQNQRTIEEDVRALVRRSLDLADEPLRLRSEQAIRNHDPCISCATRLPEARGRPRVTTVLGVGNEWRRDDAAGLEVARRLGRRAAPGVRVLQREGEPSGLLDAWEAERQVILVDAVSSGAQPGTVYRIDALAAPLSAELFRRSTHHLGVAEAVELGRALERLPQQLELYANEGRDFTAGSGLTAEVERAVEQVAAELRERLAGAP